MVLSSRTTSIQIKKHKDYQVIKSSHILLFFALLSPSLLLGQAVNAPLSDHYYHLIDRYTIKQTQFDKKIHSSIQPFQRKAIANFADNNLDSVGHYNDKDFFNLQFLTNDNWEWAKTADVENKPILKVFYKRKPDFYSISTPDLDLSINPVLNFETGIESDADNNPFLNTRGVELRARIDNKVQVYTFIGENQARFPSYVRERIIEQRAVPGEGFYKGFKTQGHDFFTARGYISFNLTKSINLQAGQDKFFIGNGFRSLVLSDFGNTYPFVKIQTQVWRFNYTNLYAELIGNFPGRTNTPSTKKFFTMHHLSLNITDNLNIGVFEAIVSGDSTGTGFELAYLNPVIFYRAAEHYTGSNSSNAMVGADAKWNFLNRFQLYGQFALDEFVLSHIKDRNGWWANKWATQLGLKYIDVLGIENLDFQAEWNRARPFMYSHISSHTSYTHYAQPLAHPLGANFDEKLMSVKYQPLKRLIIEARYMTAKQGKDSVNTNYGSDIYKSYVSRTKEFDNQLGQGTATHTNLFQINASYMLAHRMYIDLSHTIRNYKEEGKEDKNSQVTSLGIRWNIARRDHFY